MYSLHYNNRSGMFLEKEFDYFSDLRKYVVSNIQDFLMNDEYAVHFEMDMNRVQVWDNESEVLEYRWFLEN